MAKSKQNKTPKKDGQHRAETKEERMERLRKQEEARQACFKILPMVGGVVFFFMIVFALYVRSIPPKVRAPKTTPAADMDVQRVLEQAMKDGNSDLAEAIKNGEVKIERQTSEVEPEPEAPAPEGDAEGEANEPNEEHVEL